MAFNSLYQNDAGRVVDSSGNELAVEPDGSLNVNASITATEVEISNDVGNPIPISGSITATPPLLTPLGYQQLSVGNVAVGLTVPVGAQLALIQNDTVAQSGVRWRDDGVAPTSSLGMALSGGTQFEYTGDLDAIEFINASGGNDTLNISYYSYA